ncbi:MAG: hypothetical protein EG826_14020 [Deltaproteobacteria bacterium]|nr:hypothetical protein [Deltaproteobacteria bacterium]
MKNFSLAAVLLMAIILPTLAPPAQADISGCRCYCNIILRPPCGDEACKRACGWQEPSPPQIQEPVRDPVEEQHGQAEELNRQGVAYYNNRDWVRAIDLFRAALEKWPGNRVFEKNLNNAREAQRRERDAAFKKDLKDVLDKEAQQDVRRSLKEDLDKQADDDVRMGLQEDLVRKTPDRKEHGPSFQQWDRVSSAEIQMMLEDLKKVKAPPMISLGVASLGFRVLKPFDRETEELLLGITDRGVAAFEIVGTLAGRALPAAKCILAAGHTVIAMENGADIYLVKQNAIYEQALRYFKDKPAAKLFSATVQALRHHKPLPLNADSEMISTARAIIDPKLGNSGMHIAWGALWSPDALKAGLTKAAIELSSEYLIGHGSKQIVKKIQAERDPVFRYATRSLARAESSLSGTASDADRAALEKVIHEANRLIARSYIAAEPAARAVGANAWIYSKNAMDKAVEKRKHAKKAADE